MKGKEREMNPDSNLLEELKMVRGEYVRDSETLLPNQLVRPNGKPVPAHWSVYTIGEEVVVESYRFRVAYIGETSMLLEPVGPVLVGTSDTQKHEDGIRHNPSHCEHCAALRKTK